MPGVPVEANPIFTVPPKATTPPPVMPVEVETVMEELTKSRLVTLPEPMAVTPVLVMVTSPLMETGAARLEPLPSQKFPEAKVLLPLVTLPWASVVTDR